MEKPTLNTHTHQSATSLTHELATAVLTLSSIFLEIFLKICTHWGIPFVLPFYVQMAVQVALPPCFAC